MKFRHLCPQIDLDRPMESQGPFDLIVHKIVDVMTKPNFGHQPAKLALQNLEVNVSYNITC